MVSALSLLRRGKGSPPKRVEVRAQERSHVSPGTDRGQWQTSRVRGGPQESLFLLSWLHLNPSLGCQPGVVKEGLQTSHSQGSCLCSLPGLHFLSSHTPSCCCTLDPIFFLPSFRPPSLPLSLSFLFHCLPLRGACGILVPRPGIEPVPPCSGSAES